MKIYLFSVSLLFCLFLFESCDSKGGKRLVGLEPEQLGSGNTKDGEQKIYSEDGKLQSIVEVKNGKANGRVRKYYADGKLRMDAIYKDGKKNGKCLYFYGNGIAFSQSNYVEGYKEGIEKRFYEDGKVMAHVLYKKNEVQPGLKEYRKNGTPIEYNISILISEVNHLTIDGTYKLVASLNDDKYTPNFFVTIFGEPGSRQQLEVSGKKGIYHVPVVRGSFFMKKLMFEVRFKTALGNEFITKKQHNLAIDG
ncbi:MAG: hypothetical protein IPH84_03840 [Bacteroidales bacterium]|nr:hypothetical protein [Bacteroidales bacterium]